MPVNMPSRTARMWLALISKPTACCLFRSMLTGRADAGDGFGEDDRRTAVENAEGLVNFRGHGHGGDDALGAGFGDDYVQGLEQSIGRCA